MATAGAIRPPPPTCHQCGHGLREEDAICPSCDGQQTADGVPVPEEDEGSGSLRNSLKRVRSSSPDLPSMRLGITSNRITRFEQDLAMPLHASPSQPPPSSSQPVAPSSATSSQQITRVYPRSSLNLSPSDPEQIREDHSPTSSQLTVGSSPGDSGLLSDFDVPLILHHDHPGQDVSGSFVLHDTAHTPALDTSSTLGQIHPESTSISSTPYSSQPTPTPHPRQTISSNTAGRTLTDRAARLVSSPELPPLNQEALDNQSFNTGLLPPSNPLTFAPASQSDGGSPMRRSDNFHRPARPSNMPRLFRQDAIVGTQPRTTTPPQSP